MEIVEQKENQMLSRDELKLDIESEKNPSFEEVAKIIAEKLDKDESAIVVDLIKANFGSNKFRVHAKIYHSKEHKEKFEPKKKPKKKPEGAK
jgi:ribosomal protein S24E